MVEKLKKVADILKTEGKPVWLFAILKMDEFVDKWSIIISAPWINATNRQAEFGHILDLLRKNIEEKELFSIARLSLLPKEEHLVTELLKKKTGDSISNEPVNGNIIHEGQVIVSDADLVWSENNLFTK